MALPTADEAFGPGTISTVTVTPSGPFGAGAFQPTPEIMADPIAQRESGGRNVYNYRHDEDPQKFTASGFYQITDPLWNEVAPSVGVDTKKYPTAISAPPEVQTQVKQAIQAKYGDRPWGDSAPPTYSSSTVRFDSGAITRAENMGATTGNQEVRYMSPQDYLALAGDFEEPPWTSRQGKDLKASLGRGEAITDLPSLTIKGGKVTDQDGRHRALAAQEGGVDLIPVVVKSGSGELPSELVGAGGRIVPGARLQNKGPPTAEEAFGTPEGQTGAGLAERVGRYAASQTIELARAVNHILIPPVLDQALFGGRITGQSDVTSAENERRIAELRGGAPEEQGIDWLRLGVDVVNPVNWMGQGVARAVGAAPRVATALGSLIPAISQPTPEGADYWSTKELQASLGMLGGAAANAISQLIRPMASPAANLLKQGINALPGQALGEPIKTIEQALKRLPLAGSVVRNAEVRQLVDFNHVAVNRALEGVGYIPRAAGLRGTELIAAGRQALTDAYDGLLPRVVWRPTPEFARDMQQLATLAREMPVPERQQFANILQNRLWSRMGPNGVMLGDNLKLVESELGYLSRRYRASGLVSQQQLGDALREAQQLVRENLERTNPAEADQLRAINRAWSRFMPVEDASIRRATSDGIFTPGDLLQAIKTDDQTRRKAAFKTGRAHLQDLARDAQKAMGNKGPDSGTPLGMRATSPYGWAAGAGAAMLAAPMYSQTGVNMINRMSASGAPAMRNMLADELQRYAPRIAVPAGVIGGRIGGQ